MKREENTLYLVTGAAGFLGGHVCRQLLERGDRVRAFVLPKDPAAKYLPKDVEIVEGDLCDRESLEPFFSVEEGTKTICIHVASMVTVDPDFNQKLIDINVGGAKNMIAKCLEHGECEKLVYVSSTGAIPESPKGEKIREADTSRIFASSKDDLSLEKEKSNYFPCFFFIDAATLMGRPNRLIKPSAWLWS